MSFNEQVICQIEKLLNCACSCFYYKRVQEYGDQLIIKLTRHNLLICTLHSDKWPRSLNTILVVVV